MKKIVLIVVCAILFCSCGPREFEGRIIETKDGQILRFDWGVGKTYFIFKQEKKVVNGDTVIIERSIK